jgi:hypothetical protein
MAFPGFTADQLGWGLAGFLCVLSLALLASLRRKPKLKITRWVAEVPAKMIIEEESRQ